MIYYICLKSSFFCVSNSEKRVHLRLPLMVYGGADNESKNYIGLFRMQAEKLQYYEEQEE